MINSKFKIVNTPNGDRKSAYGKLFPVEEFDWRIEMLCALNFKLTKEQGGLDPKNHIWEAVKIIWPDYYRPDNFYMDHYFEEACKDYEVYSILGPGGFGKTTMEALFGILVWVTMPKHTICLFGTTTKDSAGSRIWGTVKPLFDMAFEHFESFSKVTKESIYYKERLPDGRISVNEKHGMHLKALPKGEGNVKAIFKGTHPDRHPEWMYGRLYLFFDEYNESAPAHGVFPNLTEGAVDFKAFLTGNPNDMYDALGLVSEPLEGWGSFNIMKVKSLKECVYTTKLEALKGVCIVFPGFLNPHIFYMEKEGGAYDDRFNYFSTLEKIREAKNTLSHADWMEQRIGYFPKQATGGSTYIFDKQDIIIKEANLRTTWAGFGEKKILVASDPAVTYGGDENVIRVAEMGYFEDGKEGIQFTEHIYRFRLPRDLGDLDKYEWLAQENIKIAKKHRCPPHQFCIDANTYGHAVAERIKHLWSKEIYCINPQGAPSSKPLYMNSSETAKDLCDRKVSEYFIVLKEFIGAGQIRGLDANTISELASRSYKKKGRIFIVETKTEYKKRMTGIGREGKSPGLSDTATYILDLGRHLGLRLNHGKGVTVYSRQAEDYAQMEEMEVSRLIDSLHDEMELSIVSYDD